MSYALCIPDADSPTLEINDCIHAVFDCYFSCFQVTTVRLVSPSRTFGISETLHSTKTVT